MRVKLEIDVTDVERAAIGHDYFGLMKAAPEEGVRVWAQQILTEALARLKDAAET